MHPVVAHLEVGDAGALALAGLQLPKPVGSPLGEAAQLVQFRMVAAGDHAAVSDGGRRSLDYRSIKQAPASTWEVRHPLCEFRLDAGRPRLRSDP